MSVSNKQAFGLGIVGGVLVLCTIGFFILLGVLLSDGDRDDNVAQRPTVVEPSGQGEPAAPTEITVAEVESDEHMRGNKKAKITVVEYSDKDCPFCQRFHDTMNEIVEKYGDDVRWVYRHFPLDGLHPNARKKAVASECAAEQGKFWEFSDVNFESGLADVNEIAKRAGVSNMKKFEDCVADNKYAADVEADVTSGAAAGAQGTPYSILIGPDGETIPINGAQPFANVEAAIKQFL